MTTYSRSETREIYRAWWQMIQEINGCPELPDRVRQALQYALDANPGLRDEIERERADEKIRTRQGDASMTKKTQDQNSETVVAIWNRDRTLKIREESRDREQRCADCGKKVGRADRPVIVLANDWTLCTHCMNRRDHAFCAAHSKAFAAAVDANEGSVFYLEDLDMEMLAAHFPPDLGIVERGPRTSTSHVV